MDTNICGVAFWVLRLQIHSHVDVSDMNTRSDSVTARAAYDSPHTRSFLLGERHAIVISLDHKGGASSDM